MYTVKDICKFVGSISGAAPVCVETGSTYVIEESNLIHTTTNNIASYVVLPNEGVLYSLDIDAEHQKNAKSICPPEANVVFMNGDSVEQMHILREQLERENKEVFLLCLDSKEFDPPHMVKEYEAIKPLLAKQHFVLVDDIHNPNSVKWVEMVPILKELGYTWLEIPTPTGMFMSWKD